MHLVSLPPTDDTYSSLGEPLLRECWRWKDAILGNGRDYFVPRPNALRDFQSLFVGRRIVVNELTGEVSRVRSLPSSMGGGGMIPLLATTKKRETRIPPSMSNDNGTPSSLVLRVEHSFIVEECAALSNCARLDILLVLRSEEECWQRRWWHDDDVLNATFVTRKRRSVDGTVATNDTATSTGAATAIIAARYIVAYNLQRQVRSRQHARLATWLDLPGGSIIADNHESMPNASLLLETAMTDDAWNEISIFSHRLQSIEGAQSMSTHLSLIACGLLPRPNRPHREVIFRPYSSRDAHILLQLKRTVEVVSVLNVTVDGGGGGGGRRGRGRIKTLLDGALHAGKAARNEHVVPEIRMLKEYGSEGTPPLALVRAVAEAAREQAVAVSVAACVSKLTAMETDTAKQISQLRRRVNEFVASVDNGDAGLQKVANKLLHGPTMQLREGTLSVDEIEDVAWSIERNISSLLIGH